MNPEQPQRWWTNPDLKAALILVAAGIIFFADVLFSSKNFYYRDILNFHYPLRKVLIESFARGEFPLWNPFIYLGQPMLANPNYMALYPTNLLHLIFGFNYAFKLHFILHPIAGGLGLYFLVRRLGLPWIPALAGALSYEFSGVVLSFLNLYNIIPAVALIPWTGWAFYGALQGHTWRRMSGFGVLLALQVIAFEPLILQCSVLLLAALSIVWLSQQQDRLRAIRLLVITFTAGALLAAGIAAVQVLPTLELLPLSARGSGLDFRSATGWSAHPADLLNTFIPNFFGNSFTIDMSNYWGELYHESKAGYIASFFLGSVTILLFSLSFFSQRTKLRNAMVPFLGISVILGLGKYTPIYPWMYEHVPLFDLGRYPSKYFLLTSLIVSILAAAGLESVMSLNKKRHSSMNHACVVGAAFGLALLGLALYWNWDKSQLESILRAATGSDLVENKNYPAIAASLGGSLKSTGAFLLLGSLLVLARQRIKRPAALGCLLTLLAALELVPPNIGLAPLMSEADVDFVSGVNQYMVRQQTGELGRAVSPTILTREPTGFTLRAPNRSLAWMVLFHRRSGQGLDGIRNGIQYSIEESIDYLNTRESESLLRSCLKLPPERRLDVLANTNSSMIMHLGQLEDPRAELLQRFDTHSDLDYRLYRLNDALPRAYFATNVIPTASADESLTVFLNMRHSRESVVLESVPKIPRAGLSRGGNVEILHYESSRVLCRVQAHSDGYLVLLDSYYPGWRASVDGRETAILRANFAFRAVPIPAGDHNVEFSFVPRTFHIGLAITLATVTAAAVLCLWAWIRRRRRS